MPPRWEDGTPGPELDALIRGPGPALPAVLLVGPAPASGAAAAAAIGIARAWVRTGRRVVLVDLGLAQPSLHEPLGIPNDEGIGDHFEFGTSLERLAVPVDDAEWAVIPAGAYTPDPAAVMGSPGWRAILQAAADRETTLLLFAPGDASRLAELAATVGAVVDLGGAQQLEGVRPYTVIAAFEPGAVRAAAVPEATAELEATPAPETAVEPEAAEAADGAGEPAVEAEAAAEPEATPEGGAVLEAATDVPPAPGLDVPDEGAAERLTEEEYDRIRLPRDVRSREALIADLRNRQRDALMQPPAVPAEDRAAVDDEAAASPPTRPAELAGALSPEAAAAMAGPVPFPGAVPIQEPPPQRGAPPRRAAAPGPGRRSPLVFTLIAVALVSMVAAGWHFASGWYQARRAAREAAAVAAEPVRVPVPIEPLPVLDTVLGYAVALEAHPQLPDALQRVRTLRAAMPEPGFFVAPLVREGSLFYHVMAGPVRDSVGAGALMDTLVARRHKTGGTPADIRHAPLAFLAGEYATADSAAARVAELEDLDVPAYTLPLAGPPARFRVYVGGYAGSAEAEVMGEILRAVGVRDTLVRREGAKGDGRNGMDEPDGRT